MVKKIFLVRHGQTKANVYKHGQSPDEPLNEEGRAQASQLAERVVQLNIEAVISSDQQRAKQTTEIIMQKISASVDYTPLLVERRRPSEQLGVQKDDLKFQEIESQIWQHYGQDWHYSDEENFFDIKKRALAMVEVILQRPEGRILLVSHGHFMVVLMAAAIFGETLTPDIAHTFIRSFRQRNTGLSILRYLDELDPPHFDVLTWNDHSHFADFGE